MTNEGQQARGDNERTATTGSIVDGRLKLASHAAALIPHLERSESAFVRAHSAGGGGVRLHRAGVVAGGAHHLPHRDRHRLDRRLVGAEVWPTLAHWPQPRPAGRQGAGVRRVYLSDFGRTSRDFAVDGDGGRLSRTAGDWHSRNGGSVGQEVRRGLVRQVEEGSPVRRADRRAALGVVAYSGGHLGFASCTEPDSARVTLGDARRHRRQRSAVHREGGPAAGVTLWAQVTV